MQDLKAYWASLLIKLDWEKLLTASKTETSWTETRTEFKKPLENALKCTVVFSGYPVQRQQLDFNNPCGFLPAQDALWFYGYPCKVGCWHLHWWEAKIRVQSYQNYNGASFVALDRLETMALDCTSPSQLGAPSPTPWMQHTLPSVTAPRAARWSQLANIYRALATQLSIKQKTCQA